MTFRRGFLLVDAVLLLLALLTIGVAQVNLQGWNPLVALIIAVTQATLIALFFMELRLSSGVTRLVAAAAVVWVGILLVGVLDDLLTRNWLPIPGK